MPVARNEADIRTFSDLHGRFDGFCNREQTSVLRQIECPEPFTLQRTCENWATELFGDYNPQTMLIRLWMRTAVRKEIMSFGTFLSKLCHEFCHHLDSQQFGFRDSWHTRGFYERTAALYHHARGTPPKRLFWLPVQGGRWRIDWPRTNRGA